MCISLFKAGKRVSAKAVPNVGSVKHNGLKKRGDPQVQENLPSSIS